MSRSLPGHSPLPGSSKVCFCRLAQIALGPPLQGWLYLFLSPLENFLSSTGVNVRRRRSRWKKRSEDSHIGRVAVSSTLSSPFANFVGFSSNISEANPFWNDLTEMNEYIVRCQYLLRQGKPEPGGVNPARQRAIETPTEKLERLRTVKTRPVIAWGGGQLYLVDQVGVRNGNSG